MGLPRQSGLLRVVQMSLGAVGIGTALFLMLASSASAGHYWRLDNGARIHWNSNTTSTTLRTIKIFDNMQSTTSGNRWRSLIGGARTDWDSSSLLNLGCPRVIVGEVTRASREGV